MKTYIKFVSYFIGLCGSICCAIIFPILTDSFTSIDVMIEMELIGVSIVIAIGFFKWIFDTLGDDDF